MLRVVALAAAVLLPGVLQARDASPFGSAAPQAGALRGRVYHVAFGTDRLPDFRKLHPVGEIYTNTLNAALHFTAATIPGVSNRTEWFAIEYEGSFWVDEPGKYKFFVTCDDGCRVFIDGKNIIELDGVHAQQSLGGSAKLQPGEHSIRIEYYQGPRDWASLVLEVAPPGKKFRIFDVAGFARPAEAQPDAARPKLTPSMGQ